MYNKLVVALGVGLVACFGISKLFSKSVSDNLVNSKFCAAALDELRKHKGAIHFLGEPIDVFSAKYASPGEPLTGQSDVRVNVSGSKSAGVLFFTVKKDDSEQFKLDSIQLQIGSDDTKRLVITNSK